MNQEHEGQLENKKKIKLYERQEFIPILVFISIFLILLLSSGIAGHPPGIDSITQKKSAQNQIVIIDGKNFGDAQDGGEVLIGNVTLTASAYQGWSDERIVLNVPKEVKSGVLYVITKNGRANVEIYTNPEEIPIPVAEINGNQLLIPPGTPYIKKIEPKSGIIGDIIKISGINFFERLAGSSVYFTWSSLAKGEFGEGTEFSHLIPAKDSDFDYIIWNADEIHVRVPDGAKSGGIVIKTEKGVSKVKYFEIQYMIGSKYFKNRKKYTIKYFVEITDINTSADNGLYLWIPKILETPEQRDIALMGKEEDIQPMLADYKGVMLFYLDELQSGRRYEISKEYIFDRYEVKTEINPTLVLDSYDKESEFYKYYTGNDFIIQSDSPPIKELADSVIGYENNPYYKAKRIYEYIIANFSYSYINHYAYNNWQTQITWEKGDSFIYAVLFTALCRSAGIPARLVAGYIVDRERNCIKHFWSEFYINGIGWIPVDSFLGDNNYSLSFVHNIAQHEYYFGNLDNSHITFSKGVIELKKMTPKGKTIHKSNLANLQNIHEEAKGNLHAYSIIWHDIKVLGIY